MHSLGANKDIVIDTTAPAAPVIGGSDGAPQSSTSVNLSGTAEGGTTIKVYEGTTQVATTPANSPWSVSFTSTDGTHNYTATATDPAGNTSGNSNTRKVIVDSTAPDVTLTAPTGSQASPNPVHSGTAGHASGDSPDDSFVTIKIHQGADVFQPVVQTFTASVNPTTGAFSQAPPSGLPIGQYTAEAIQQDAAHNTKFSNSLTYNVTIAPYSFTGFFPPVNKYDPNNVIWNIANTGQAIPVKFSLGGNKGLDIFSSGYPAMQTVPCNAAGSTDPIEQTVTAGQSSLTYDAASNQYTYVWKTDKTWGKGCRQLILKFKDGQYQRANFNFTK